MDLLHVLKRGTRLGFRLFDLEDEFTAVFGRPVDLVAHTSVNTYLREQVLTDARPSMRRELLLLREMRFFVSDEHRCVTHELCR